VGRGRAGFVVAITLSSAFAFALSFAGAPAGAAPPPVQGTLSSVSCTATTACVAVGSYVNDGDTVALAERWNGTAWTNQATPNPAGGTEIALNGVSCPSATKCLAVGSYEGAHGILPLAERWNGSKWTIERRERAADRRRGVERHEVDDPEDAGPIAPELAQSARVAES
jgi:hypothetical protein